MTWGLFLTQVLNGLQLGILLFLLAAGLTLVFGIMNFVNLAHGSIYMMGAYFAAAAFARTGSFIAAGAIAGCDSGTDVSPEPPAPTHVVIQFAARAGEDAIDCDNTATAMGAAQDKELALRDFRFYVGNVRLVKPSGAA